MRCSDARLCLVDRDALDPSMAEAVEAHLGSCAACAGAVEEQQLAVAQLRRLPLREPPPGLEARLLALPSTAAAPMSLSPSLSPVLTERIVWLMLAAATVVTAWGLWRVSLAHPGGFRPDGSPSVADERDRGESAPGGVASRGADPGDETSGGSTGPTVDALAVIAEPTLVARLRTRDLRTPPIVAARGMLLGSGGPIDQRPPAAPPGRSPRGGGAGVAGSAASGEGDDSAASPTAAAADDQDAPSTKPKRRPTPVPTAASACTTLTLQVRIFADVAGGEKADCPGCDGLFDDRDLAAMDVNGWSLPSMQVGYYSGTQPDVLVYETTILAGDARRTGAGEVTVTFPLCVAPEQWPVITQLVLLPDDSSGSWGACPSTGLEASLSGPEAMTVAFALRQACPVASPLPVTATATAAATEPSGPAAPGGDGRDGTPQPPAGTVP